MTTTPWPRAYSVPSRIASPCPARMCVRPTVGSGRDGGRGDRGARARVVGADLCVAAVAVVRAGDRLVLARVGGLGHPRRGGRAGDVGDRRDVVPVDAVADAEQEAGQQDAEVRRGGGGGDGRGDEVEHRCGSPCSRTG